MADNKQQEQEKDHNQMVVDKAMNIWDKYSRQLMIGSAVIIILAGSYLGYKYFISEPNEKKAADAIYKAEDFYRADSINLALNGDGVNLGFLKVIEKYGSTKAANLARFYAGDCYLKLGDNANAIKHLEDFSTGSKQVQARAYKLIGDANADLGKNAEALNFYKKAASYFPEDDVNSSEYLFMAAYFAQKVMADNKEATALYQSLKDKFPRTEKGYEADKYLAQLGVYN
jgi:hypothetical protein